MRIARIGRSLTVGIQATHAAAARERTPKEEHLSIVTPLPISFTPNHEQNGASGDNNSDSTSPQFGIIGKSEIR